jgi:hypothetical protein
MQVLDQGRADRAEIGHDLRDFPYLVLIQHLPQLGAVFFAEAKQEDRRALWSRQRPQIFLHLDFGSARHVLSLLMQPSAHDRHGFLGMALDDIADFANRGLPHLAIDLTDVDHAFALGQLGGLTWLTSRWAWNGQVCCRFRRLGNRGRVLPGWSQEVSRWTSRSQRKSAGR